MAIDLSMMGPSTQVMSIATPLKESVPSLKAKGLTNRPGQNNCFLNSSIQVSHNTNFALLNSITSGVLFLVQLDVFDVTYDFRK